MSTGPHGSEEALADLACDRLAVSGPVRVLVGGLGLGFTLSAVLRRLGSEDAVTVAELLPSVVCWNQDYPRLARFAGYPLRDPRVTVHVGDVLDLVQLPPTRWSAILLDIDNGPHSLTRPTNGWLYTPEGIDAAFAALVPGGVLAIWSAAPSDPLTKSLADAGFVVEVVCHTERGRPTRDNDGTHVVWVAQRPDRDNQRS
ncbi:MAG: hypothetical protein KTR31_37005 [Myxococcales bacterium]|nr:hypothetical protein [Myxococcales bacterium]